MLDVDEVGHPFTQSVQVPHGVDVVEVDEVGQPLTQSVQVPHGVDVVVVVV